MKRLTQRGMLMSMFVLLITFAFTTNVAAKGGGKHPKEQWDIMTYVPDNNYTVPVALPVEKSGHGVAFDFYPTPDRALLITDDVGTSKKFQKGDLTGKSLSTKIAIEAPAGATFNYYDNNTGGSPTGGFVHVYFQTGITTGWNPGDPEGEAKYWWSNPIHIDLVDLAASDKKGIKLQVPLDPNSWSDRDGHLGTDNSTINHTDLFNKAAADVSKVGLSFGGAGWWAFGCGVNAPNDATFKLLDFKVKK